MGDSRKSLATIQGGGPRPGVLVAVGCALTLALFAPLTWHVLHSFHACQAITETWIAGEELRDAVCHTNAELVLDARRAALGDAASDASGRTRTTAELRRLLDRTWALQAANGGCRWVARADSLQQALRDAEAAAILLAGSDRRSEALDLLTSPGYASIHADFHAALDSCALRLKQRVRAAAAGERVEEMHFIGVAAAIMLVCAGVWAVLLRLVERWRRGLEREAEERREAQRRLAAALRQFRRLFHHAHDAIYLVAPDGRIIDANRAAGLQTGYSRRKLKTMRFADLDAEPRSGAAWPLPRGLTERTQRRRDGTVLPVETAIQPVDEQAGAVTLCIVRDVGERKAMETELARAQKLECVGRLAAGIAHDFGNILLAISGFAVVGRRRLPTGHAADEALARIEEAVDQATGVARSLLHFANRPSAPVRPTELRGLVRGALDLLAPTLPRRIDLDDDGVTGPPLWAEVDPHRLQQAVLNLCLNARDAMATGGCLSVAIEARDTAAGPAVRIAVADTGPGIAPEVRRRLGEAFFTTRGDDGGCGLGLFNVRTIMAECGGRLEIDSLPGHGATFTLVLPRIEPVAAPPPTPAPPGVGTAPQVLLVLAGDLVRGLAGDALRAHGFSVTAAGDSAGLRAALDGARSWDAAVIDGDLPGPGAAACLDLLRRRAPDTAVVVIRGERPLPPAAAAAAGQLARPCTMPELCDAVGAAAAVRLRAAQGRS